jgi:hypothetical protein
MILRLNVVTKGTQRPPKLLSFSHIFPSEKSILTKLPQENINFQRGLRLPNPLVISPKMLDFKN